MRLLLGLAVLPVTSSFQNEIGVGERKLEGESESALL